MTGRKNTKSGKKTFSKNIKFEKDKHGKWQVVGVARTPSGKRKSIGSRSTTNSRRRK